jgi:tRNA(Ile)-lysidine synthase
MNHNLKHVLWKQVKSHGLESSNFLVALSGGCDSVALLHLLNQVVPSGALFGAYVHHGRTSLKSSRELDQYREHAAKFNKTLCEKYKIPFIVLKVKPKDQSEAELRRCRYEVLRAHMNKNKIRVLALGHHKDDLLETRLIRLIRGVSAEGLESMQVYQESLFRPFLDQSKGDLIKYLKSVNQDFLEDPSNTSENYLRNWIRNVWLPPLEEKRPGSLKSLSRSLDVIAESLQLKMKPQERTLLEKNERFLEGQQGISRPFFLSLTPSEKLQMLAQYMISRQKYEFSQSHLNEIKKNLDKSQKELKFRSAHCDWICDARRIYIQDKN